MKNNQLKTIIIFGFSGSGKSVIANSISEKYKIRVIHPSGILRNLCEGTPVDINNTDYNKGFWESEEGIRIFKNRLKEKRPLDSISDRILLQEIDKHDAVIDSWSLPWLTKKGITIYLKADIDIRAKRVAKRDHMNISKIKKIITMKDNETRKLFKRIYGFDIKDELHVFDLVLNTDNLNERQVYIIIDAYLEQIFH